MCPSLRVVESTTVHRLHIYPFVVYLTSAGIDNNHCYRHMNIVTYVLHCCEYTRTRILSRRNLLHCHEYTNIVPVSPPTDPHLYASACAGAGPAATRTASDRARSAPCAARSPTRRPHHSSPRSRSRRRRTSSQRGSR